MHHQQKRRVIAAIFDAHGGPKQKRRDPGDAYDRDPTTKGEFVVAYCAPQSASARYGLSSIPWGSRLRREPKGYELEIELKGRWQSLKNAKGIDRRAVERAFAGTVRAANDVLFLGNPFAKKMETGQPFPSEWILNDFGHVSCFYFKDINGNRRQDKNEKMSQEVFHPTPVDEFLDANGHASLIQLSESHGCIHVKPKDIDTMIAKGYLATGNDVTIHSYVDIFDRTNLPDPLARRPYSVHFYPASKKLVVHGWSLP